MKANENIKRIKKCLKLSFSFLTYKALNVIKQSYLKFCKGNTNSFRKYSSVYLIFIAPLKCVNLLTNRKMFKFNKKEYYLFSYYNIFIQ